MNSCRVEIDSGFIVKMCDNVVAVIFGDNLRYVVYSLAIPILLSAAFPLHAAVKPVPSNNDARLGKLAYDGDQIFLIQTGQGVATHIILAPDERIIASAAGMPADCHRPSGDWCIVANAGASEIFVQPRNAIPSKNNLQLTTNLRRYSFDFVQSAATTAETPWYRVTFIYGQMQAAAWVPPNTPTRESRSLPARVPDGANAEDALQSSTVRISVAKALESYAPAEYTVYPQPEVDLSRPILFDRSRNWRDALSDALRVTDIGMAIDADGKKILLKRIVTSAADPGA